MQKWAALLIGFSLLLASCGSTDPAEPSRQDFPLPAGAQTLQLQGKPGGTLRYPLSGEPATFNLLAAQDTRSIVVGLLFTATLLELDPIDQTIQPGVAESWQISEDGLTVTLKLRSGLLFGDGTALSAQDVLFTFQQIMREESQTHFKTNFHFPGQSLSFESPDAQTVRILLARPDASMEFFLSQIPVLPRHLLSGSSRPIEEEWNLETPADQITGLGPFLIESHQPGLMTVLRRNPHYWKVDSEGLRLPYLDRIELHYITDINNQVLRLQAGELDLIDQVLTPESFQLLSRDQSSITATDAGPSNKLSLLWFNLNPEGSSEDGQPLLSEEKRRWFSDPDFRRAISLAINRQEISRIVFLGYATPASGVVTALNRTWRAPQIAPLRHDRQAARRLLQEAGFSWGGGGDGQLLGPQGKAVRFELLTTTETSLNRMAALIQQDLKAIGIDISLRQEELRSVISRVINARRYDAALSSFTLPWEPSDLGSFFYSSGQAHLWNPMQLQPATAWEQRIDDLMSDQRVTLDHEKRRNLFHGVQQVMADNAPALPLIHWNLLMAHRSQLRNLQPTDLVQCCLWNAWELYFDPQ